MPGMTGRGLGVPRTFRVTRDLAAEWVWRRTVDTDEEVCWRLLDHVDALATIRRWCGSQRYAPVLDDQPTRFDPDPDMRVPASLWWDG